MGRPSTGGQPPPIYYCATWHPYATKLAKAVNGKLDIKAAEAAIDLIQKKLQQIKED